MTMTEIVRQIDFDLVELVGTVSLYEYFTNTPFTV